ncbi:MAG: hypothetical protein JNL01_15125 [Bdellovibrionales bacterium]|nr:hypothetical protein [Bdellovibrionales bacterium]
MKFAILTALASVALANSAHAIDYVTLSNNQTIVLQPNTTTEVKCGAPAAPVPAKVCSLVLSEWSSGTSWYKVQYIETSTASKAVEVKAYSYGGSLSEFASKADARIAAVTAGKALEKSGFCVFIE